MMMDAKKLVMELVDKKSGLMKCKVCGKQRTFDQYIDSITGEGKEGILPSQIKNRLEGAKNEREVLMYKTLQSQHRTVLYIFRQCHGLEGLREYVISSQLLDAEAWHCANGCTEDLDLTP